jgi:hypothetical protein
MRLAPRTGLISALTALVVVFAAQAPAAAKKAPKPPRSVAVAYVGQSVGGGAKITKLDRLEATARGGAAFTAFLSRGRYGIFWSYRKGAKRQLRRLALYSLSGFYSEAQRLLAVDANGDLVAHFLNCHYFVDEIGKPQKDLGDGCFKQDATYPKRTVIPEALGLDFAVDLGGQVYYPARVMHDNSPTEQPFSEDVIETIGAAEDDVPRQWGNRSPDQNNVGVGERFHILVTDHRTLFDAPGGQPFPAAILGPGSNLSLPSPGTISTYTFGDDGAIVCAFDGPRFFNYPDNPHFTTHPNFPRGAACGHSPDVVVERLAGDSQGRIVKITGKKRTQQLGIGERVGFAKATYKLTKLYGDRFSSPFRWDGTIAYHGTVGNARRTEAFIVRQP